MKTFVIASLVILGCGGKKDEGGGTPAETKPTEPPPTETKPAETQPAEAKPADKPPQAADTSHGTCVVKGTGAVTFEQTTPHGGGSTLNVMQWHTPEMRQKIGYQDEGIILNCLGPHVRLSLLSKRDKPFPMKPAAYKIGGRDGVITAMATLEHDKKLAVTGADGTLEITAFDDKHIAGKGDIVLKTLPSQGEIKLAVEFDMQCYGLSGCK